MVPRLCLDERGFYWLPLDIHEECIFKYAKTSSCDMAAVSREKLKAVIHYIANECGNAANVGKTVFWKILYFSDFDYYEKYETHLTGEEYGKLDMGPAPRHWDAVIAQLTTEGKIGEVDANFGGFRQKKFISLAEPDLTMLSAQELEIINKAIKKISGMTAQQASEYSHRDMPWKAAKLNATLDYEMVFYRDDMLSVVKTQEGD